jgi:hypothetical protein
MKAKEDMLMSLRHKSNIERNQSITFPRNSNMLKVKFWSWK